MHNILLYIIIKEFQAIAIHNWQKRRDESNNIEIAFAKYITIRICVTFYILHKAIVCIINYLRTISKSSFFMNGLRINKIFSKMYVACMTWTAFN